MNSGVQRGPITVEVVCVQLDKDQDGIADQFDTDSDNDGCNDADEAYGVSGTDSNGDGTFGGVVDAYDSGNPTNATGVAADGTVNAASYTTPATTTTPAGDTYLIATEATVDATALVNKLVVTGASTTFQITSATATSTTGLVRSHSERFIVVAIFSTRTISATIPCAGVLWSAVVIPRRLTVRYSVTTTIRNTFSQARGCRCT